MWHHPPPPLPPPLQKQLAEIAPLNNTCMGFLDFDLHPMISLGEGAVAVQGAKIHHRASYLPRHSSQFALQKFQRDDKTNSCLFKSDCQLLINIFSSF